MGIVPQNPARYTLPPRYFWLVALLAVACGLLPLSDGSKGNGNPDGLYLSTTTFAFGGSVRLLEHTSLFTSGGSVYSGLPKAGADHFDWNHSRQAEPHNTGTYEISGSQIRYRWADGKTESETFSRIKGGFVIGGYITVRMARFNSGQRLAGTYGFSNSVTVGRSSFGTVRFITFKPDGMFTGKDITDADVNAGIPALHTGGTSKSADAGTYQCGGYTMELKYGDGRDIRCTGYPYPNEGDPKQSPARLSIAGILYTLEKKR